jgi:hypothetical protein
LHTSPETKITSTKEAATMLKTKTTTAPEWHQTEFDFKTGTLPDEVASDTAIHGKAKSNGSDASLRTESNIEHAICPRTALRNSGGHRSVTSRGALSKLISEFLRGILIGGPVPVADIEAQARVAGLLGPLQQISGAKLFKKAKKILAVRSKRVGFGAAGDWFWELSPPASPTNSQCTEQDRINDVPPGAVYAESRGSPEQSCRQESPDVPLRIPQSRERIAGVVSGAGAVQSWRDGVASLNPNRPAAGIPPQRWRQFIDDCNVFLDPGQRFAEFALQKGWDTFDLFGCHPTQPLAYLASAGLMWAVSSGKVIELHRGWAVIEYPATRTRRNFDQRRPYQTNLTLPWWLR